MLTTLLKRWTYTALALCGAWGTMISCQQADLSGMPDGEDDGRLRACKSALITRSVPPNAYFEENRAYRLWAYRLEEDTDGTYLFTEAPNGVLGKESTRHYIQMPETYTKELRDAFHIYGFTDDEAVLTEDNTDNDKILPSDPGSGEHPTYTIAYDPNLPQGYKEYYRADLKYVADDKTKTSPVMEFKHILSRVRVQVIQQDQKSAGISNEDKRGVYDLQLHAAELQGVYGTLVYDVRADKFSLPDGETKGNRRLKGLGNEGQDIIPVEDDKEINPFSESFVFPTLDEDKTKKNFMTLRLTISGKDAAKFPVTLADGGTETDDGTTRYYLDVQLYDSYAGKGTPLVFEANYSYMLRVVFAKTGVVTFVPEVYPWFDGETDGWTASGEGYEEQVLGNTQLFNNLIWADRNLGAKDYYPIDRERFEKCTGYYYQFGRNIPYFPMKKEGELLTEWVEEDTDVYPVVSDPAGRLHEPRVPTDLDRSSIKAYAGKENSASIPFVTELEKMLPDEIASKQQELGYNGWSNGFNTSLWNDVLTQPTPPGWRLPTQEELYSIFPTNTASGNITMMKTVNWDGESEAKGGQYFNDWPESKVLYVRIPTDQKNHPFYPDYGGRSGSDNSVNGVGQSYPQGQCPGSSYIWEPEGDPAPGDSSEYIISKKHPGECFKIPRAPDAHQVATIYAIKKVGTPGAYRMRWRVVCIDENAGSYGYYALVIERFTATADDRLSYRETDPDYFYNYDWTRPVAILYLPISGIIGDTGWCARTGRLGNFGTEMALLTSEAGKGNTVKTYHIKIIGSDNLNQCIFPAMHRRGTGAQIRLVRETTYQPNRPQN